MKGKLKWFSAVLSLLTAWSIFGLFSKRNVIQNEFQEASGEQVDGRIKNPEIFKRQVDLEVIGTIPGVIGRDSEAFKLRKALVRQHPDHYFDPNNTSFAYRKNLSRHRIISRYVNSPIKDHPSMQQLMVLLLENGYDVSDWNAAVNMLTTWHMSIRQRMQSLRDQGVSGVEMEQEIQAFLENSPHIKAILNGFKFTTGMEEGEVLDQILKLDFPAAALQEQLADPTITIYGDRLLEKDDWFTEEFREARSRYQGPPRPSSGGGYHQVMPAPGHEEAYQKIMTERNQR